MSSVKSGEVIVQISKPIEEDIANLGIPSTIEIYEELKEKLLKLKKEKQISISMSSSIILQLLIHDVSEYLSDKDWNLAKEDIQKCLSVIDFDHKSKKELH